MNATGPVGKRRYEECGQHYLDLFPGKYIIKNPVYSDGADKADERIENYIDIIITKAKNIDNGKKFDEHIALKIIPP